MKIGTKSILFGYHCFFIHPWFTAYGWYKLYGFPFDPRLWVAFFVHDLGYLGKPNMDGPEGEEHVWLGAKIMSIFGKEWKEFSLYHSRFYAKKHNKQYSKLCVADKLAYCYYPAWLCVFLCSLSGEIVEYLNLMSTKYKHEKCETKDPYEWYYNTKNFLLHWVAEHKDLKKDQWTKV